MPELETQIEIEYDATEEVLAAIDFDELTDNLEGRSGFRKSNPKDRYGKLTGYIWRMAAFHAGYNDSIPVMAAHDLQAWLDENDIDARVIGMDHDGKSEAEHRAHDAGDELKDVLDGVVVDIVIDYFNEDPMAATRRWNGILY